MREYEAEGEKLILEAVDASPEALAKVEQKLKGFREQVYRDYAACSARPDFEEFSRRCKAVLDYVNTNLGLIKRLGHLYIEDRLNVFEERVLPLLSLSLSLLSQRSTYL